MLRRLIGLSAVSEKLILLVRIPIGSPILGLKKGINCIMPNDKINDFVFQ